MQSLVNYKADNILRVDGYYQTVVKFVFKDILQLVSGYFADYVDLTEDLKSGASKEIYDGRSFSRMFTRINAGQ